ncbi:hypothetical protein Tco_0386555 [Tanacetum coccineum]
MDNPDITIEEYIKLEAEKARRRGQTFNWENATYGKVRYCEDIDYFKDFETDFPTVVYKDALASDNEISSEPTVSPHHDNRVDFDFKISFDESDDEDYTVIYDKKLFYYKLIYVNDLKSDSSNDNDEINILSEDVSTKLLDSVIDSNVNTYSQEVDENFETNHNIHEPTLKEFVEKAQIESNLSNTNDDMDIKLRKEFLMELQKNTYHGRFDEDVVDHIAKVLEILDLINIPRMDTHRLRIKVFPLSLADDARQW